MAGLRVAEAGAGEGGVVGESGRRVAVTREDQGALKHPLCLCPTKTSILRIIYQNLTKTRSKM